ncbi:hypothetical protein BpHYR1_007428 [Brachionus plicatilis]|uniref:Uncharacterized protein n=1 Tax=Brachionus plicatilis TaxID=10195 RepID=A0A3M7SLY6_BRAPC|nr:hypothetical protein BpHYR1_007428 [Brachionus plicatilis]
MYLLDFYDLSNTGFQMDIFDHNGMCLYHFENQCSIRNDISAVTLGNFEKKTLKKRRSVALKMLKKNGVLWVFFKRSFFFRPNKLVEKRLIINEIRNI